METDTQPGSTSEADLPDRRTVGATKYSRSRPVADLLACLMLSAQNPPRAWFRTRRPGHLCGRWAGGPLAPAVI